MEDSSNTHDDHGTPTTTDPDFPYSILISVPLPTMRLASCAVRALEVDQELSSRVRRSLTARSRPRPSTSGGDGDSEAVSNTDATADDAVEAELSALFEASTNRLLRVAVNGYMESLRLVIGVMEELDVDVLGGGKDS